jgi:hypothetical protein
MVVWDLSSREISNFRKRISRVAAVEYNYNVDADIRTVCGFVAHVKKLVISSFIRIFPRWYSSIFVSFDEERGCFVPRSQCKPFAVRIYVSAVALKWVWVREPKKLSTVLYHSGVCKTITRLFRRDTLRHYCRLFLKSNI